MNVELLQSAAVISYALYAPVGHQIAGSDAKFFEVRAALRQGAQAGVADVTLADVEGPQPRARPSQNGYRVIAHGLASSCVQVPEKKCTFKETSPDVSRDGHGFRKGVTFEPTCINIGRLERTEPNLIHFKGAVGSVDIPFRAIHKGRPHFF